MVSVFLLIRRISAYTGADVLLGVFLQASRAEAARDVYRARYAAAPDSDPWRRQAYRADGLAADDLGILTMDAAAGVGDEVVVVSRYAEAFGQVLRRFDSVHASEAAALARVSEVEQEDESFPAYVLLQRARVDVLLSDAPADQPA